ncbi:MAG: carboxypeptidase regulatory-like domain-containing protein [Kofleriaceae bacterium]
MKRNHIILALGLALAVVGWLWLRSGDDQPAKSPSATSTGGFRIGGATLKAQREVPTIEVETDQDPRGELSLLGLVLDDVGGPVAGATITIDTNPPRSVESESDGSFVIDQLVPRSYEVAAQKESQVAGPVSAQLIDDSQPITLRMRGAGALEVTVVDGGSKRPIAGALVELRGAIQRTATSDAEGKALLRGVIHGAYVLAASAPGYARLAVSHQGVELPAGIDQLTLGLQPGTPVSGSVSDDRGKPIEGARVFAEDASVLAGAIASEVVLTDRQGRWKMAALVPGTYRFAARGATHAPGASAPVVIKEAPVADVQITLTAGAQLAGKVVNAQGAPAPRAAIRVVVDEGSWGQGVARQTVADAEGAFSLQGLPRARVHAVATRAGRSSLTRTFDLEETPDAVDVVIALDADGELAGVVKDRRGAPVPDAVVVAEATAPTSKTRAEATLRGKLSVVADGDGKFLLRGLPADKYALRANWPGASLVQRTSWMRPAVVATTGSRDLVLTLEEDGQLLGKVQREDGQAPKLMVVSVGGGATFGGVGGRFSISRLPAGKHTLTITGPDFATRVLDDVELEPGQSRDLGLITVVAGRTIRGRVLDGSGSPVAGAAVVATKQIRGVVAGPAGALVADAKRTVTAEDGGFQLDGLASIALSIGAEAPGRGKSDFTTVPAGTSSLTLDLTLNPVGGLRGVVTRGGQPIGGAAVVLSAKGATSGGSGVTTGTDGTFQFTSLTPGSYGVIVMFDHGGGPLLKRDQVTVHADKIAQLAVELPKGEVTLVVAARTSPDRGVASARVFLTEIIDGKEGNDGRSELLSLAEPARFTEVSPGSYRLCVVAQEPPKAGAPAPAPVCSYLGVTESPSEQRAEVEFPTSPAS